MRYIGPKFQCRESWLRGDWPPEFFLGQALSFGLEHSPDIMIAIGNFDNFVILILAGVSLFSISRENFHPIPPLSPRI